MSVDTKLFESERVRAADSMSVGSAGGTSERNQR
jgi:hypothetical protein